ncbi:MAG: fatty acid--CoA ligase family protein, partial [Verrucomicrobiota bacterium]
ILLYLRHGATILLPAGEAAEEVIRFADRQQATVIYASPDHYQHLLETGQGELPASLRLSLSTSMGLSEALVNDFARRFNVHLTQALGIIEVGLPVVNLNQAVSKPLALGQVQPDFTVTLQTHEGDEISRLGSDSGVGEVCIQGPGLFDAYLSPWIPATEVISEEGFRTGDLGYFDEDHDLYLLGRRQNRINIGGRKFFCEEVEAVLNGYADIRESRVRSEKVNGVVAIVADVVTSNGESLDTEALQQFCQSKLTRYKIPVRFSKVEQLDKTATGKIRRWS